jgi:hypothetical protein
MKFLGVTFIPSFNGVQRGADEFAYPISPVLVIKKTPLLQGG